MPFQVTYTLNFKDTNYPTPEEFLATLDPAVLEILGISDKTPAEIYTQGSSDKMNMIENSAGFVEYKDEFSADKLSRTVTHIWETKEAYENAFQKVCDEQTLTYSFPVDLEVNNQQPTSGFDYIRTLYGNQYCTSYVISFANS